MGERTEDELKTKISLSALNEYNVKEFVGHEDEVKSGKSHFTCSLHHTCIYGAVSQQVRCAEVKHVFCAPEVSICYSK